MYSPGSIIAQLKAYLPKFDSNFITSINVTTASISTMYGNQILNIPLPNHGLKAGKTIVITGSLINNNIVAVSQFIDGAGNSILTFTTGTPHDLTLGYTGEITLAGFSDPDSALNGENVLINVLDEYRFDITYPDLPTLSGGEMLVMHIENGLDGVWQVIIIDSNTIAVKLSGNYYIQDGSVPSFNVIYNFRIYPAYDLTQALDLYTQNTNDLNAAPALFVIMGDTRASKDTETLSEALAANTNASLVRTRILNDFSIVAVFPNSKYLTPSGNAETCYGELLTAMYAVIAGYDFGQTINSYTTNFKYHGQANYNKAYYVHIYEFEYVYDITNDDLFLNNNPNTVRMNKITQQFLQDNAGNFEDEGSYNEVGAE